MELGATTFCPSCYFTAAHYIGLCQYSGVESPSADAVIYVHLDTSLKLRQFKSEYSASQVCSFNLTCCRWGTVQQCRDPHQCHTLFQWLWVSQTSRQSIHRAHVGVTEQSRGLNQCWPSRQSEAHQDFYCHSAPLRNYSSLNLREKKNTLHASVSSKTYKTINHCNQKAITYYSAAFLYTDIELIWSFNAMSYAVVGVTIQCCHLVAKVKIVPMPLNSLHQNNRWEKWCNNDVTQDRLTYLKQDSGLCRKYPL